MHENHKRKCRVESGSTSRARKKRNANCLAFMTAGAVISSLIALYAMSISADLPGRVCWCLRGNNPENIVLIPNNAFTIGNLAAFFAVIGVIEVVLALALIGCFPGWKVTFRNRTLEYSSGNNKLALAVFLLIHLTLFLMATQTYTEVRNDRIIIKHFLSLYPTKHKWSDVASIRIHKIIKYETKIGRNGCSLPTGRVDDRSPLPPYYEYVVDLSNDKSWISPSSKCWDWPLIKRGMRVASTKSGKVITYEVVDYAKFY